ncbi:MAG TPA: N(4)-(beta-N-acetylglucosaminyl)-L-asparaginase [Fimbriimonadaceae bacterium]|nr:N(4)-(beta-N-acetylglucosaminyl)-L-asparaginase [Fimbriimonadaceae bacterium]
MERKRTLSRRELLAGTAAAGVAAVGLPALASAPRKAGKFLAVSSGNGMRAVDKAMEMMKAGEDTLDAAVAGVNIIELDPDVISVGYGGLPNADGVVELDSCVMHGPTYNAGAVGALRNIKTPSRVAKVVMERSDHVFLVGQGALDFAKMHGFKEEDLLTDKARELWVRWKENLSQDDDYIDPNHNEFLGHRPTGTITCMCLNDKGDISGTTTTSGLAFKIPGRVGDSPLIGCGVYVDNEIGACGSTGRGEANILMNGSRIVVENMRHGMAPQEAIMDVLHRICEQTKEVRLLKERGVPNFQLQFYALNKDGVHAGGCIHGSSPYTAHDGESGQTFRCQGVFAD